MGRKNKKKKNRGNKTWEWRKVNIGKGWTLLSVECYLQHTCQNCIYYRYCKTTQKGYNTPVLRQVIRGLFAKYGKPPADLIDKACQIGYNDLY